MIAIVLNQAAYNYIQSKKALSAVQTYLRNNNIDVVPIAIKDTAGGAKRWILTADMFTKNEWRYLKDRIAEDGNTAYIQSTTIADDQLLPPKID